ncbi:MAG: GYD domain-containing protein [Anaerolineae bacterium]|jgi:uncharacterized protein with GYD domain|nr:GYD domain-containing protein [Anaerolineae bacterium]
MATYIMLGKYSLEGIKEVSAARTEKAVAIIEKNGGVLKSGYAMLGEQDLILVLDFPGTEEAMKASVDLAKLTGIAFTTSPAVSLKKFDKLVGKA